MFKKTNKILTALTFGIFLTTGSAVFADYEKCANECWRVAEECQSKCQDAGCRFECFFDMEDCFDKCKAEFPDEYKKLKSKTSKGKK